MRVVLPSPLFSYSGGQQQLDGAGESVAQLLDFLESRYAGMRHRIVDEQDRIRPHIRFFVNGDGITGLDHRLKAGDEVIIVAALSGG
ncbi:MAG TPA: MoaD/ThiS family protein [Burkholderiales bacterium]|jgi:molybdopterin converting factor small subunit|nr:MoaD/ThiS family protein [Burkholderiales bacterium]